MDQHAASLDATPVILARIETKLDRALLDINDHGRDISRLDFETNEVRNRLIALETTVASLPRRAVTPAVVWTALGVAVAALGVLITMLSMRGG